MELVESTNGYSVGLIYVWFALRVNIWCSVACKCLGYGVGRIDELVLGRLDLCLVCA